MNFQGPPSFYPMQGPPHLMNAPDMSIKQINATLYIGDIDDQLNEGMLYQYFIKFGPIYSVRIMRDVYNQKKSRGFGYVTYYNPKDAEAARINANHDVILKKPIRVTWKRNFRDLDKDANIFIRNISQELRIQDIDSYFSKYGAIFSSKMPQNENTGELLGYGYIQFEKKEQAEACLQEGSVHTVRGFELKVERFQSSKTRDKKDLRNNLFVKNLPSDWDEKILNEKLLELFKPYGEIGSLFMKKDPKINRYYVFCCFKLNQEATACLQALNDQDPFGINEKLYINYAEKKETRMKRLRESFANIINETNLFTKNILKNVTEQQLNETFSKFGKVTSCAIKEVKSIDPKFPSDTNFGFICFSNRDEAKLALANSPRDKEVQELYKDKVIYITYHYRKEQYQVYKEMKRRTMAKYFQRQVNPMFIPFPMHPAMFGFGGAPGFSHPMMNSAPPMPPRFHGPPPHEGGNYRPQNQRRGPPPPHRNRPPYQEGGKRSGGRGYQQKQPYEKPHEQVHQAPLPQPVVQEIVPETFTIPQLKEKLTEFTNFPQDKQRTILGELLFPLVQKHTSTAELAPKVTGMLIDFSVFEVSDIIEFLDNAEILHERVMEAEELIKSTTN